MCELSVSAELTDGWGEAKQRLCVQRAGSGTICVLWVQKSRVWHRLCVLGLFFSCWPFWLLQIDWWVLQLANRASRVLFYF